MSTLATYAHDQRPPSLFARRPILMAVVVGVGSLLPHALIPREVSLGLAAILIAGIYFGFAVTNGSGRDQMIEFNVTSLFAVAGLLGMLYWPLLLPIAYLAHASWDLAHHNRARLSLVAIPRGC